MQIAVIGKGLIGGSFEKAAKRAGHEACVFDKGEDFRVEGADVVFVAVPPSAVVSVVDAIAPRLKEGADPMAGKEKTGYENSDAALFDGASMILTPYPTYGRAPLDMLEGLLGEMGFARIVYTTPAHHDEMIAFTSQLCHLISSAYVREPLAADHVGYSAGSFRDMVRVGAPDPDTWTELFFANREALLPVLERYIARMEEFRGALAADDRGRMHRALEEGVAAKSRFGRGIS